MPSNRNTVLRGPAAVTWDALDIFTKGDIDFDLQISSEEHGTSAHGRVLETITDRIAKVSLTPAGEWENLAKIFRYAAFLPGQSMITGVDLPLAIITTLGKKHTLQAAAITKLPSIFLSSKKTMLGGMEWTALGKDNTAWSTANSLLAITTGQAFPWASFNAANMKVMRWAAVLGGVAAPWNNIKTKEGWTIDFDLKFSLEDNDEDGTYDIIFQDLGVMAKCQPVGVTEEDITTLMGFQGGGGVNSRGKAFSAIGNDLVITGSDASPPVITVTNAALKTAGFKFGGSTLRAGEIGFVAQPAFTNGQRNALYTIA